MPFWAKLLAGVVAIVVLAWWGMVLMFDPTLAGLRPHAVKDNLNRYTLSDLLAKDQDGAISGILTRDVHFQRRGTESGYFWLPGPFTEKKRAIPFAIRGGIDPELARFIGAQPVQCGGTGVPNKMILAVQPNRNKNGFLGRSTCQRTNLDLKAIIDESRSARVEDKWLSYTELVEIDAGVDPLISHLPLGDWPTPYRFHRHFRLPTVWGATGFDPDNTLNRLESDLRDILKAAEIPNKMSAKLISSDYQPNVPIDGSDDVVVAVHIDDKSMGLSDIRFRTLRVELECADKHQSVCDSFDPTRMLALIEKTKDHDLLKARIATQRPLPKDVPNRFPTVDSRNDTVLETIETRERRFRVTVIDARVQSSP